MKKIVVSILMLSILSSLQSARNTHIAQEITLIKQTYLLPYDLAPEQSLDALHIMEKNAENEAAWKARIDTIGGSSSIKTFRNYQLPSEWQQSIACEKVSNILAQCTNPKLVAALEAVQQKINALGERNKEIEQADLSELKTFINTTKEKLQEYMQTAYGIIPNMDEDTRDAIIQADKKFNAIFDPLISDCPSLYTFLQNQSIALLTQTTGVGALNITDFVQKLAQTKPDGTKIFASDIKKALIALSSTSAVDTQNLKALTAYTEKLTALITVLRAMITDAQSMYEETSSISTALHNTWLNKIANVIELFLSSGITIIQTRLLAMQCTMISKNLVEPISTQIAALNENTFTLPSQADKTWESREKINALLNASTQLYAPLKTVIAKMDSFNTEKITKTALATIKTNIKEIPELTKAPEITTFKDQLGFMYMLIGVLGKNAMYNHADTMQELGLEPVPSNPLIPNERTPLLSQKESFPTSNPEKTKHYTIDIPTYSYQNPDTVTSTEQKEIYFMLNDDPFNESLQQIFYTPNTLYIKTESNEQFSGEIKTRRRIKLNRIDSIPDSAKPITYK